MTFPAQTSFKQPNLLGIDVNTYVSYTFFQFYSNKNNKNDFTLIMRLHKPKYTFVQSPVIIIIINNSVAITER